MDTVVPSDSISQIGSSTSRRHRKKKHSDGSSSVASKHSSTSKHSRRSHKSRSHHDSDEDNTSQHSAESKHRRKHRPSVVSEPSDASTVKPVKPHTSRKDSVTQGQYDGLFDEVKYGTGSVAALPVRGITPSMVSAAGKNKTRTVVRHDMAQKARLFE
jgi:hypothetical protein